MDKNEYRLPLFYQQVEEKDTQNEIKENETLNEFVVCCLLDPKFPAFVNKMEKIFVK